mmetsp:Transcript_1787/g.2488  ORF Transcript_1787/g.2488 Transcript_1787/m.2488 type:complete len:341 (+) Transcript_1787:73-1095(+)
MTQQQVSTFIMDQTLLCYNIDLGIYYGAVDLFIMELIRELQNNNPVNYESLHPLVKACCKSVEPKLDILRCICWTAAAIVFVTFCPQCYEEIMTVEDLKCTYSSITDWGNDNEQRLLLGFANYLRIAITFLRPRHNKGVLLNICGRLEGMRPIEYITGSAMSAATTRRVNIFQLETKVTPIRRRPRVPRLLTSVSSVTPTRQRRRVLRSYPSVTRVTPTRRRSSVPRSRAVVNFSLPPSPAFREDHVDRENHQSSPPLTIFATNGHQPADDIFRPLLTNLSSGHSNDLSSSPLWNSGHFDGLSTRTATIVNPQFQENCFDIFNKEDLALLAHLLEVPGSL